MAPFGGLTMAVALSGCRSDEFDKPANVAEAAMCAALESERVQARQRLTEN